MGLLKTNDCLSWNTILEIKEELKKKGIEQFIHVYKHCKANFSHSFIWGDEIECIILTSANTSSKPVNTTKLVLCGSHLAKTLKRSGMLFSVEFASYMIETTPQNPHQSSLIDILTIEDSMMHRLSTIRIALAEIVPSGFPLLITHYPKIMHNYFYDQCHEIYVTSYFKNLDRARAKNPNEPEDTDTPYWIRAQNVSNKITKSDCFPDNGITEHNRFSSFVKNIRNRRGRMIEGYIRVLSDEYRGDSQEVNVIKGGCNCGIDIQSRKLNNITLYTIHGYDYIKIDSMGQGMGNCCLQLTLQASSIKEARILYDMLAVICPILLRLTRATPISQNHLLATETRWDMLQMSVDCRTDDERGYKFMTSGGKKECVINTDPKCIKKSRYSSIDMFISTASRNLPYYNDINPHLHQDSYEMLLKEKVDPLMAKHISSLFIRDPILAYDTKEDPKSISTEEFENIQSSNWRSMRFKLPYIHGKVDERGWKVEVRPMEIQPTIFENAAYCIFVVLLSRAIVKYNINFYMPISMVDENFKRVNQYEDKLLYYRQNVKGEEEAIVKEGTMKEILLGDGVFIGLIGIVERYIKEHTPVGEESYKRLMRYVGFIRKRADGRYMSVSEWMRRYVKDHKGYSGGAYVSDSILDDMLMRLKEISENNDPNYLRDL